MRPEPSARAPPPDQPTDKRFDIQMLQQFTRIRDIVDDSTADVACAVVDARAIESDCSHTLFGCRFEPHIPNIHGDGGAMMKYER